jgi:hypothetical protein
MHDNNDTLWAILKVAAAWVAGLIGSITLSKLVLFATLVFTVMQTYVLFRDKIAGRGGSQ